MKATLIHSKLKEAVSLAEKATSKNLSLPILNTLHLSAKNNTLLIRATNLDIGLELELPAKVDRPGQTAAPAAPLSGFLNNLTKEEKISFSVENHNLIISTPSSTTTIKCHPDEDFPTIPKADKHQAYHLPSHTLVSGLRSVLYAASLSDIKPEIASVYLYQHDGDLIFVATDSFRLAEKKIALKNKTKDIPATIIPAKNVNEIIRVFEGVGEEIEILVDKNQITFQTAAITLTSRVIDGNFPDYRQIMPTTNKTSVTLGREDLLQALKLTNVFSDKFNQITLAIKPKEKTFTLYSQNQDIGENTISVSAVLEGEEIELSLNGKYLLDCFQSIEADTVTLLLSEKNRPLLVRGVGDKSFSYLVMPINR